MCDEKPARWCHCEKHNVDYPCRDSCPYCDEVVETEKIEKQQHPLELITKIEFFEKHSSNLIIPYTEIHVTVSDLKEFMIYCVGEESWEKNRNFCCDDFEYNMKKAVKSKAKNFKFDFYLNERKVTIYPRENKIVNNNAGIHYICQHIFDFIPHKDVFYQSGRGDFIIGKLRHYQHDKHPDRFPDLEVKSSDILFGFMNQREENLKYGDSFYMWIDHRKEERAWNLIDRAEEI